MSQPTCFRCIFQDKMTCPRDTILLFYLKPKWPCQASAPEDLTVMSAQTNAKVYISGAVARKRWEAGTQKWSDLPKMKQHGQDWLGRRQWEMERIVECYRINNAKGNSFLLTLGQALSVYRKINRCETVRTKADTGAVDTHYSASLFYHVPCRK